MSECFAVIVPMENTNDEVATIVRMNIASGEEVKKGEVIITLETMKAVFEIEAEESGFFFYKVKEGDEVRVGSEIAYICKENRMPEIRTDAGVNDGSRARDGKLDISAKAAKLMKEHGLRDEDFAGMVRVKLEDVKAKVAEKGLQTKGPQSVTGVRDKNCPSLNIVEISPAKKYEIRQLRESSRRVIASSVSVMIDFQKVEANIRSISQNEGVRAAVGELIIYNVSRLLKKYNLFNGYYDKDVCAVYSEINVGFAVNMGRGLKVPVIRNADKMSVKDISNTVKDLSLRYFREELALNDLAGGTFTVTDISSRGVVDFIPVINNMQSAILGVCAVMPGTGCFKCILTFDHQMADGMMAADMLNELSTMLQGK
ncbi:MAG: 2-oxo acid dehydrogenase subunit E2 [Planctomycetes bacterium]|nr:2-oxo acid dehydrogenase subunit E2 [Planctomycetota bacterium]MBI5741700.1 2-oxo acid dehydrogenase subunit E2 [Nitrospirota bacterium]